MVKFGILAPGSIAHAMADTVSAIPGIEKCAVGSRDLGRAQAFAEKWGFAKAYGSYEELAADPEVELVYIASPHSHHYRHAKLCLEHGKHVLVEKTFTVNAGQAEELVALAEEKKLLLADAIWTRYLPGRKKINEIMESGIIGEVSSINASLCIHMSDLQRMWDPRLAGGCLLDLSIYPLTFALMFFPEEITKVDANAVMSPLGVDWINNITLTFESGRMAVLHSNMLGMSDGQGMICGSKGYIKVKHVYNCREIYVYDHNHNLLEESIIPEVPSLYSYEILSCIKALREGRRECEEMPHAETIRVMRLMDSIRQKWRMKLADELDEQ